MTCCNENCNQGRDCPVRKVKPYPYVPTDINLLPASLRRPLWTDRVADLARALVLAFALIGVLATIISPLL